MLITSAIQVLCVLTLIKLPRNQQESPVDLKVGPGLGKVGVGLVRSSEQKTLA